MAKNILVIDDEDMILESVALLLEDSGRAVSAFSDSGLGMGAAIAGDYDLIVSDVQMPGLDGAELVEAVLASKPAARVLLTSAAPRDPVAVRAMQAGAIGLLKKPFAAASVLSRLG